MSPLEPNRTSALSVAEVLPACYKCNVLVGSTWTKKTSRVWNLNKLYMIMEREHQIPTPAFSQLAPLVSTVAPQAGHWTVHFARTLSCQSELLGIACTRVDPQTARSQLGPWPHLPSPKLPWRPKQPWCCHLAAGFLAQKTRKIWSQLGQVFRPWWKPTSS